MKKTNIVKSLSLFLALIMIAGMTAICVNAESEVSSVEADDVEVIPYTNGSPIHTVTSSGGKVTGVYDWWKYDVDPRNVRVSFSDGSSYEGDLEGLDDLGVFWYSDCAEQSYDSEWGAGAHTVTFFCGGKSTQFDFVITESPVASVEFDDIEVVEGTNCYPYSQFETDPETGEQVVVKTIMYYREQPNLVTVTMKDGEVYSGSPYSIETATGYEFRFVSDQSIDNPWGLGDHTAKMYFLGYDKTYNYKITETPAKSVSAEVPDIIEGTSGYFWNNDENSYFHYYLPNDVVFTVTMKNGDVYTGTSAELADSLGVSVGISDDQRYENQWGIGKHFFKVNVLGVYADIPVNIIASPVKSITLAPLTLTEGADGSWAYDYTDGEQRYFRYSVYYGEDITVEYKDGKKETATADEFFRKTGYSFNFTSEQSALSPWTPGNTYKAKATFMNVSAEYDVNVKENNVASVSIEGDVEIEAFTSGRYDYHWTESGTVPYFVYEISPEKITVTEKSGAKVTGTAKELEKKYGGFVSIFDDQDYTNQWTEGNSYTAELAFMGRTAQFTVRITEKTVKSVSAKDTAVQEYTDGVFEGAWDYVTDTYKDNEWYRYSLYPSEITVEYTNGKKVTFDPRDLSYEEAAYLYVNDGQSESHRFDVGVYTVEAEYMGVPFTYKYEIKKGPDKTPDIASVDFDDVNIEWNQRTFTDDGNVYYIYSPTFTVHFVDGTSVKSVNGGIAIDKKYVGVEYDDGQLKTPWTPGSTHKVKVSFMGFEKEITVTVGIEPGSSDVIPGDVTGDGKLNAKDVTAIMKFLVGAAPKNFIEAAADYDSNGKVNAKDVTKLMKYLVS